MASREEAATIHNAGGNTAADTDIKQPEQRSDESDGGGDGDGGGEPDLVGVEVAGDGVATALQSAAQEQPLFTGSRAEQLSTVGKGEGNAGWDLLSAEGSVDVQAATHAIGTSEPEQGSLDGIEKSHLVVVDLDGDDVPDVSTCFYYCFSRGASNMTVWCLYAAGLGVRTRLWLPT